MSAKTVQPVHFEDFSGHQFERLLLAYCLRTAKWKTIQWYGEVGADSGRDIWGVKSEADGDETTCFQCANTKLSFTKIKADVDKIVEGPKGAPNELIAVTSSSVSASLRERIEKYAVSKGIAHCQVWSGSEFEERLRKDAEPLLRRFQDGVEFPDSPTDIRAFVERLSTPPDEQILALMAELFDRPAFYTPYPCRKLDSGFQESYNGYHRGSEHRSSPTPRRN